MLRLQRALARQPTPGVSALQHQMEQDTIAGEQATAKSALEAADRKLETEYDAAFKRPKAALQPERETPPPPTLTAPTPDIRVTARAAIVGGPRPAWALSIDVQNHSPTDFFLQNVYIETSDGQQAYVARHFVTQEWNGPKKIEPGNSYDFLIGPKEIWEFMREHRLVCAVAVDKIGRRFRSDPDGFVPLLESIVNR